jgi:hypothetical protein
VLDQICSWPRILLLNEWCRYFVKAVLCHLHPVLSSSCHLFADFPYLCVILRSRREFPNLAYSIQALPHFCLGVALLPLVVHEWNLIDINFIRVELNTSVYYGERRCNMAIERRKCIEWMGMVFIDLDLFFFHSRRNMGADSSPGSGISVYVALRSILHYEA